MLKFLTAILFGSSVALFAAQASAQATPEQLDEIAKLTAVEYDKIREAFAEAREWLKDEAKHKFACKELKRETAKKFIDDLYAAGAVRVYTSSFTKEGDVETTPAIMIVVGGKPEARTKTFQTVNDFYKAFLPTIGKAELVEGFKQTDAGQPIIPVILDF